MTAFDENQLNELYSKYGITNASFTKGISNFSNRDKKKAFNALSALYNSGGEYKQNAITSVINDLQNTNSRSLASTIYGSKRSKNHVEFLNSIDRTNLQSNFEDFITQNKITNRSFKDAYEKLSLTDREKALATFNNTLNGLSTNNNLANATYNLLEEANWTKDNFSNTFITQSSSDNDFWTNRNEIVNNANKNGTIIDRITDARQGNAGAELGKDKKNFVSNTGLENLSDEQVAELYGFDIEPSVRGIKGKVPISESDGATKTARNSHLENFTDEAVEERYGVFKPEKSYKIGGKNYESYVNGLEEQARRSNLDPRRYTVEELGDMFKPGGSNTKSKGLGHGKAALAVGTAVTAGALVLGLSSSRGQQSNAQLYGQQPLSY